MQTPLTLAFLVVNTKVIVCAILHDPDVVAHSDQLVTGCCSKLVVSACNDEVSG